jgi:Tfp pilus assembly protein PilN
VRPVNLIPPEERRGDRAPARTGPLPYLLLAGVAIAVGAVALITLTGKQIDDRTAQVANLEAQEASARAEAEALSPYAEFASLAQSRQQTVNSLAESRFDWERVLRELARVIPGDVWLTDLTGTVSPEVELSASGGESDLRGEIAGPALSIVGCATGHDAVAGFLAALEDIDGVTRVAVAKSELPEAKSDNGPAGESADCRTRGFISRFEVVAAFDAAPTPQSASTLPTSPPVAATPSPPDPETADALAADRQAKDSAAKQSDKADQAADIIPGTSP